MNFLLFSNVYHINVVNKKRNRLRTAKKYRYFAKKIFFFHVGIYAGFNNKLTPSNKPILIDNYALQNKVCVR